MKKLLYFSPCFYSSATVTAQKVGLGLSGGGAKGAAHIGVIKRHSKRTIFQ